MWFAVISEDVEESLERRKSARAAHLTRLESLLDQGRLLIAGPHPAVEAEDPGAAGFSGSLVIADFSSLEEAESWAQEDPYVSAGVYSRVVVKPFKLVLP